MLDNGAVFQEFWDDILEGKVDSEIGGQVIRVQTQKQSFNFQKQLPRAVLRKGVLKICSKFTGEGTPKPNAIVKKLQRNFIEIALWQWCSHVNLLHIFRTPFLKNRSGCLLLNFFFFEQLELLWCMQTIFYSTIRTRHVIKVSKLNKHVFQDY